MTAAKRLGTYRTPNTVAGFLRAAIGNWAHVGTIQVHVVATDVIARSRRPKAAVATSESRLRGIEVAGVEEVIREGSKGSSSSLTSSIGSI